MLKNRKVKLMFDEFLSSDVILPETEKTKFHLYKKQRELFQLNKILESPSLNSKDNKTWLRNNNDLVFDLAESFVDDSLAGMEGSPLDGETIQLSFKVMKKLRDTVSRFEAIVSGEEEFEA